MSDAQVTVEIEAAEDRSEYGAWAVVFGLVLEIVFATAKSLGYENPNVENWGAVVADSLIAFGVYAEIHFGRKASQGQREQVARANERAANFEREAAEARERTAKIEQLTAWRHITPEQQQTIVAGLRNRIPFDEMQISHGKKVRNPDEKILLDVIVDAPEDAEVILFTREILNMFEMANVRSIKVRHNPVTVMGNPVFGLYVSSTPEQYSLVVRKVFDEAGVPASYDEGIALFFMTGPAITTDQLHVYVGHKPRT